MPRQVVQVATFTLILMAGSAGIVRADQPSSVQVKQAGQPEPSAAEKLNQQELEALRTRAGQAAPDGFMGPPLMLQSIEDITRLR